jgi:hypothetical protein
MAQYVADLLTSQNASDENTADFILRADDNRIAYVDIEGGEVWLITVEKAEFVAAVVSGTPEGEQ